MADTPSTQPSTPAVERPTLTQPTPPPVPQPSAPVQPVAAPKPAEKPDVPPPQPSRDAILATLTTALYDRHLHDIDVDERDAHDSPIYPRYSQIRDWATNGGRGGSIELNQAANALTEAAELIATFFTLAAEEANNIDKERQRRGEDAKAEPL